MKSTAVVHCVDVPLCEVACPCGEIWFSPEIYNVPNNCCPQCGCPPIPGRMGPVETHSFPLPIDVNIR